MKTPQERIDEALDVLNRPHRSPSLGGFVDASLMRSILAPPREYFSEGGIEWQVVGERFLTFGDWFLNLRGQVTYASSEFTADVCASMVRPILKPVRVVGKGAK